MGYILKPIISQIISRLKPYGFYIVRIRGDHIIVNRNPPLKRPIVLVNKKEISNAVRLNLIKECQEAGVPREVFDDIFR